MQLKVDTLLKLAIMDAGHDHDTQGGVGHHDHKALADLSWPLDPLRATDREVTWFERRSPGRPSDGWDLS